jgi:electron transfer flavoprotein alpha subunit
MKGKILVLAEHKDGVLDNITWELLGKGRAIADQWQTPLAVLLVGAELDGMIEKLKTSGADLVLTAQDAELKNYNAELYTSVIAQAAQSYSPSLILMGYTYLGMEVGPALSVRLGGTMVSNCMELDAEGETLTAVRPIFGGTLQSKVELSGPAPYVASIEKGVLPRDPLASKNAGVEAIPVDVRALKLRSRIIEILMAAKGEIDITKAKILVSVGRGIGSPDKIPLLKQLADALGGQLSCSRPVADMGWLPFAHQVGISANTVTPEVYLACGISGASQHVTAMRDSAMIIAINSDPNAPIFRVAHYGIVGDLNEVIPHMIAEANAMK